MPEMDYWQLKVYCKVVETKSFSKAGRLVHLSQPTVSSHIKELEDHFNCRLIDRLPKEAVPTKAGVLLYTYACRLLALTDETESALAAYQGKIQGRMIIGASTIPGVYLLPRVIGSFSQRYPAVTAVLNIADTEKTLEAVLSGAVEIGVVGAATSDPLLEQEALVEDQLALVVAADHKWARRTSVPLAKVAREPFIVRERGSGTLESMRRAFEDNGLKMENLKVVAEMGNTPAVIQAIKSRAGVSVLSTTAVAEDIANGALKAVAIDGLNIRRFLYLTRLRRRTPSPLVRVFTLFLKNALAASTGARATA
jgi:DNA-binding transcriptional LysR family regulator